MYLRHRATHFLRYGTYLRGKVVKMTECKDVEYDKILDDNSTSKFYIEYIGFMSNHISHGIIALHRLGASESKLQQFVQWYSTRLENPDGATAKLQEVSNEKVTVEGLLGARKSFYTVCKYYTEKLGTEYGSNLELLVRGEFDKLSDGLVGSALHGLISLGYGFAAKSPKLVCEGLAYMHHSYAPLLISDKTVEIGKGATDITEVIAEFRQDKQLREFMLEEIKKDKMTKWVTSDFQRKMFVLFKSKGDELMKYVAQVKIPHINPANCSVQDTVELCKWVLDCVIFAYAKCEKRNDFFLVHCVTGTWSLCQLLPALSDPSQACRAVRTMLCAFFAAYMVQGAAPLNAQINPELMTYKNWDDIVNQTVSRQCDEHIYKIIQVLHERSNEISDEEKGNLYIAAANVALGYDLSF